MSGHDASGDDFVELGEILFEKCVALIGDLVLHSSRLVGVTAVERFNDAHAFRNFAEGSKVHRVQTRIVAIVYEYLRASRIGRGALRVSNIAAKIALLNRIILDIGISPDAANFGIGRNAKLNNESRHDAEERGIVVEMVFDEIVEAVSAIRGPGARDFDSKVAFGGVEVDVIHGWSRSVQRCRIQKRASC